MTIKRIDKDLCDSCEFLIEKGCLVIESCPVDVLRLDEEKKPSIAYPEDCDSCFLCQIDCPKGAIHVTAEVPLLMIPS